MKKGWKPSRGNEGGVVLSFSELAAQQAEEGKPLTSRNNLLNDFYANADEAFFGQNIFSYVGDEVHVLYALLYVLTIPGALLHWALLSFIPVRKIEQPEVRELRGQGMYTAIGIAVISLPFAAIGLYLGDAIMVLINEVALAVNLAIIATNLIGLKVVADELHLSIRTFAIGAWVIVLFLIGLALVDTYAYLTFSWLTIITYTFRLLEILVYSVIAVQCIQLWDLYADHADDSFGTDVAFASALAVLFAGVIIGFLVAISISAENAWRILYW